MSSAISIEGVSKRFQRMRRTYSALESIDLEIEDGEFLCLLGPSGCGKSTLLNMVAGFEMPSEGSIRLAGERVLAPGRDRGMIFQADGALYEWLTVTGNVELPLKVRGVPVRERRRTVERHLALVHLDGQEEKYPQELSGGMRQRLQIARVLANEPEILLMDEPFGALDSQTRRLMQRELARIWEAERKTVLFITHDIDEALLLGDRIAVMSRGPAARIKTVIPVDLPRPRERGEELLRLWNRIDQSISEEIGEGH